MTPMINARRGVDPQRLTEPGVLQVFVVGPAHVVAGGERFLDYLELVIHPGLQLEYHTAVADGFRFEDYVPLTAIGDGVA
jgi:hypothetical protein